MACVVLMSASQVVAFEDRNRKYKIVMNNHEKVADKLKKRFKNAEKLKDVF